jgi:hypothetical protein
MCSKPQYIYENPNSIPSELCDEMVSLFNKECFEPDKSIAQLNIYHKGKLSKMYNFLKKELNKNIQKYNYNITG